MEPLNHGDANLACHSDNATLAMVKSEEDALKVKSVMCKLQIDTTYIYVCV